MKVNSTSEYLKTVTEPFLYRHRAKEKGLSRRCEETNPAGAGVGQGQDTPSKAQGHATGIGLRGAERRVLPVQETRRRLRTRSKCPNVF